MGEGGFSFFLIDLSPTYVFLSLNGKFGACTNEMLNVALLCRLANGL